MPDNLEVMLRNQVNANLNHALDTAVQAGDVQTARKVTQQLQQLALETSKSPDVPKFSNNDIRAALKSKASWFGIDPRRSAKAVEFGKNMEPQSFPNAEAFAEALIKSVNEEYKTNEPKESDEEEPELEEPENEDKSEKKPERKRTDAPSGEGVRAIPRRTSGAWTKLSDAPKEIADTIRSAAERFTRNATKEQKEKYIVTALGTAYASDQRSRVKR